ncbi:MAG TPA: NADH-quinone oxidoreductase subunit N [Candidatus Acidoferrum sp.]|nr:NADH-quinone oxidoreductase subunit N [Candidatus Acidoferrum sp.]
MPVNFFNPQDLTRFLPEILLTIFGTLLMVLDPILTKRATNAFGHLSILALLAALGASIMAFNNPGPAFGGMLIVDGFSTFFCALSIVVGILTVLSSYRFLARQEAEAGEYHALLLFSIAGQCLMAVSNDLIMVFIGLEISSIASYVLAGYLRDDKRNNESALKYFLLGSFATAFFLYGVALVYGATGSVNLPTVRANVLQSGADAVPFLAVAAALMFVGLAFKISAAPFQMWAPDVYQGAPTPVSAFMSAGPKAAAFAVFLRIFYTAFEPIGGRWEMLVWVAALLSMCVGNFAALLQTNIKRMLAYSSIAHAGYVLVALTARNNDGTAAVMFYLAAYALMNIGAFAAVAHLSGKGDRFVNIDDFKGLARKQPLTAAMFTVFLLSFIGVPLTGGFLGKFYIFRAALESRLYWLTVLGLLNSAVAAYYYLRILVMMYMHEPSEATEAVEPLSPSLSLALLLPALGTLVLGIFPNWVMEFAGRSANLVR